ncbi:MAG: hypothetical protein AABW93_02115 [Nanoarchaeota archaeon]
MGVIKDADLAATFSSERPLSASEILEIAQRTRHSVHLMGRIGAHKRWHYHLYSDQSPQLREEGIMYLVNKGLKIVSSNPRYDTLIAKFFSDRKRSHDLTEKFGQLQNS